MAEVVEQHRDRFPAFVAALLLQMYLSVRWNVFPLMGMQSDDYLDLSPMGKFRDILWHSALPITCYTYGSLAYYSRFIRSKSARSPLCASTSGRSPK